MLVSLARQWGWVTRPRSIACWLGLALMVLGVLPRLARAELDPRKTRLYLAEAAMVIEGSRRLLLWTERYGSEPEFARFAHPIAERYVEMAGRLVPPEHLVAAHPHLILVVENVERALDAASGGDTSAFRQRARTVREELVTLESVLKQFKARLPELPR